MRQQLVGGEETRGGGRGLGGAGRRAGASVVLTVDGHVSRASASGSASRGAASASAAR